MGDISNKSNGFVADGCLSSEVGRWGVPKVGCGCGNAQGMV